MAAAAAACDSVEACAALDKERTSMDFLAKGNNKRTFLGKERKRSAHIDRSKRFKSYTGVIGGSLA